MCYVFSGEKIESAGIPTPCRQHLCLLPWSRFIHGFRFFFFHFMWKMANSSNESGWVFPPPPPSDLIISNKIEFECKCAQSLPSISWFNENPPFKCVLSALVNYGHHWLIGNKLWTYSEEHTLDDSISWCWDILHTNGFTSHTVALLSPWWACDDSSTDRFHIKHMSMYYILEVTYMKTWLNGITDIYHIAVIPRPNDIIVVWN